VSHTSYSPLPLPFLSCLHADTRVGQRLVEVLDIICSRLNRSNGLLYSTYLPTPKIGTWQGAPESDINYGEGKSLKGAPCYSG
jgi:hypothetical protein